MKKTAITISYDEEKYAALKLYMEQRGCRVEEELTKALDTLYTKVVPANVRDFIELRAGMPKPTEKKKKPNPLIPTDSLQDGSGGK